MANQDVTKPAAGRPESSGAPLLLEPLERRSLFSSASGTGEVHEVDDDGARSSVSAALQHESESQQSRSTVARGDDEGDEQTKDVISLGKAQSPTRPTQSDEESSDDSAGQPPVVTGNDESETEKHQENVPGQTSISTDSEETPKQADERHDSAAEVSQDNTPSAPSPEDLDLTPISQSASQATPSPISFGVTRDSGDIESSRAENGIDAAPASGGGEFSNSPVTTADIIESTVYAGTLGAAFVRQQMIGSAGKLLAELEKIVSNPSSALQAVSSVVAPVIHLSTPVAGSPSGTRFSAQRIFHFARIGDPAIMLRDAIAAFIDDSTSGTILDHKFGWQEAAVITGVVALADVMLLKHLQKRKCISTCIGTATTHAARGRGRRGCTRRLSGWFSNE